MEARVMESISDTLRQELTVAIDRYRRTAGVAALEDVLGPDAVKSAFANVSDGVQASESRELGFATREILAGRIRCLTAALERWERGVYGTCRECEAPIPAARLRAIPEVETCVWCQHRIERERRAEREREDDALAA
jgi:RNA polymerase-binding transcription factor DksA